jgi:hypothetical protein
LGNYSCNGYCSTALTWIFQNIQLEEALHPEVDNPETPRIRHRKIGGAAKEKCRQAKKGMAAAPPEKSRVISLRAGSFKAGTVVR